MGKLNKSGIDAGFRDRVEYLIEPGHSAVVVMASKITEDKFRNRYAALRRHHSQDLAVRER